MNAASLLDPLFLGLETLFTRRKVMEPSLPRLMDRGIHVSRIRRAGGGTGGKSPGLPTPRNEKCPIYSEKNPQIEFLLRMGF